MKLMHSTHLDSAHRTRYWCILAAEILDESAVVLSTWVESARQGALEHTVRWFADYRAILLIIGPSRTAVRATDKFQ